MIFCGCRCCADAGFRLGLALGELEIGKLWKLTHLYYKLVYQLNLMKNCREMKAYFDCTSLWPAIISLGVMRVSNYRPRRRKKIGCASFRARVLGPTAKNSSHFVWQCEITPPTGSPTCPLRGWCFSHIRNAGICSQPITSKAALAQVGRQQ